MDQLGNFLRGEAAPFAGMQITKSKGADPYSFKLRNGFAGFFDQAAYDPFFPRMDHDAV